MISRDDRVYAAGFFDADGCVGIYWNPIKSSNRGGVYRVSVQVSQKESSPTITAWFQTRWGGSVAFNKTEKQYHWIVFCKQAEEFLRDIEPFAKGKHDQIVAALEFRARKKHWGRGGIPDEEFAYQKEMSNTLKQLKTIVVEVNKEARAWTSKDSLNPPKNSDRLVNETGIRLSDGACVLYRAVFTAIKVDSTDGYSILNIEDSATDGGGTVLVSVPFQAAGETVEIRFRNGLNFTNGMGLDLTAGTAGDGQVMITKLFAQTAQA